MSIKEALANLGEVCGRHGYQAALDNHQDNADIDAAESAVLALYEKQKAIADELAEAIRLYIEDDDATVGELKTALATYNKAREGR